MKELTWEDVEKMWKRRGHLDVWLRDDDVLGAVNEILRERGVEIVFHHDTVWLRVYYNKKKMG